VLWLACNTPYGNRRSNAGRAHSPGLAAGAVEPALASLFRPIGLPALRGRIQHFRRLGLTPPAVPGRAVQYDFDWTARWFLALLLTIRRGDDPVVAVKVIKRQWGRPGRIDRATAEKMFYHGEGMQLGLGDVVQIARYAKPADRVIATVDMDKSGLPVFGAAPLTAMSSVGHFLAGDPDGALPVVTIFDLSEHMRRLDAALAAASAQDESSLARPAGITAGEKVMA
jgi:hypothetical protein